MARTKLVWLWNNHPKRRPALVANLLLRNPTAVEPAPEVMTRARRRRIAVAAAALPEEILVWEILVRLPAKDILRFRTVCRSWRRITSAPGFLLAHHRRQPLLPLVALYGADSPNGGSLIFKHGRPILGFDDYQGFELLLASCDGLLLLSLSDNRFIICNPTTRQSAPLPGLAGGVSITALYLHRLSGKYRILYWRYQDHAYYILTVRRGQSPRCIGVPSDIPAIEKVMLAWHRRTTINYAPVYLATPVVLHDCLHWDLCCDAGILVFDMVVESFRLMRCPAAAAGLFTRLCDMEGSIGFSCSDGGARTAAKIWVLEDYEREVWSFKYHVKLQDFFHYIPKDAQHLVLSDKGDVLVYMPSSSYMYHYDNTGKLLEEFQCDSWGLSIIGHWFKESLVKHDISLRRGCSRVFQRI